MNLQDSPLTIARIAELEELVDSLRANIDIKASHLDSLRKELLLAEERAEHFKSENEIVCEDLRKQLQLVDDLSERIRMMIPGNPGMAIKLAGVILEQNKRRATKRNQG